MVDQKDYKWFGTWGAGLSRFDGKNWKTYTSFTMGISKKVYLGLAVTSHNTTKTATAVFRNVSFVKE